MKKLECGSYYSHTDYGNDWSCWYRDAPDSCCNCVCGGGDIDPRTGNKYWCLKNVIFRIYNSLGYTYRVTYINIRTLIKSIKVNVDDE